MKKYPLESLLRPPVEWWSSLICLIVSIFIYMQSSIFLLSTQITAFIAIGLFFLGVVRFFQGYRVISYQNNLKRLSFYAASSDELPISQHKLFLGKGFKWEAKHTQRLRDLKQSTYENYLKPGKWYQRARQFELKYEHSFKLKPLINFLSSQSRWNSVRPLPPVGGNPAIHGIELNEKNIFLSLSERVGHTMILGTTRVGKTRLLELMIASDIRRNDSAVIVFDPKGDMDLLKRVCFEAKKSNRASDVIVFHLGYPSHSARYNPIGNFSRITEVANRVANQLPSSGESAAFKEFAWRFVNIIANALEALGKKPNYKDMDKYILNIDSLMLEFCAKCLIDINPEWQQIVEIDAKMIDVKNLPMHLKSRKPFMIALVNYMDKLNINNPVYDGLKAIFNYDQTYFQKITASLSPLFSKLTSGRIAELISPNYFDFDDERLIFDWLQVIRGKKIVYVGLDALSDSTVSSAVGNSMFADLCSTVGQIYKFGIQDGIADSLSKKTFNKINLYSDEFNELVGDEFIPLANKGGGAGLQLTVATQTGSDVLARLGSQAKANQVFGNFNNLICLRVLEESTARLLTDKLPQRVQVRDVIQVSSANDAATLTESTHFSSHTEDRITVTEVPLISSDDLMQLPKGQAFCLLDGGQLYKVRFPLPKNDMALMSESVEKMVEELRTV
ncbi:MAG: conjugative coupling factor TraD, PFGI-1 class [Gammaproteobacteria bacterium CG_4_10_14_0_8_um_filter_38_16]|nr:MAG: conjugative coupling factor TraD, PFGI-1 class [Gammaproteobacteria bacterium CG_4_10_14_0_8_um_filter_38_16]PJA04236.1 MAG: conjugative coupling factor TraD, PFGI-1 class [Gammaproteobacteria bacterium CG_4_10_14_0_2_um_filter_38_22]PJB10936.1 MAG: conjugative coupling factor TraD, PFGI-1 class [Gammaproteobacteria bacterium CG_4_9_14_3_um_filter_38_9]